MIKEIAARRSIRRYSDKPVEEEKIAEILESGRLAPSGSNTQPWNFILIQSAEMRKKLAEASHNQKWMLTAPLYIVCVADIRCRVKEDVELYLDESTPQFELKQIIRDSAIAMEHMVLEAEHQGLGTCWVAWFKQEDIRPILNIPTDKYVVSILTVGYVDKLPKATPRRKLEEIVHYETWNGKKSGE